jgi:hypothetical protein
MHAEDEEHYRGYRLVAARGLLLWTVAIMPLRLDLLPLRLPTPRFSRGRALADARRMVDLALK